MNSRPNQNLWALLCLLFSVSWSRADEWKVFPEKREHPELTQYLKTQAYAAFARRSAEIEKLKTPEQWKARQRRMRNEFIQRLGGFPKKTPLNAKVVGVIDGDRYRIEKVIYESQPQHYVTASLYVPKGKGPFPAVVIPSGHSTTAKAAGYNQSGALILVKHGIAALCYDPIGQGERSQMLDENGKPLHRSTREHTLIGAASILVGRSTATYRIWDGMRSIDYLVSRKDIDAKRIGVTGCSGGGTLSSYLMALDDRVRCAAPSCYLTTFHRLIDTIGPQDAEQNVFGQIGVGLDHADYVTMRSPTPIIMLVATRDFFDITGAWNTFREGKRAYTTLGYPERLSLIETDTKHGYPQAHREAMLRWMRRWLMNVDKAETEPELITQKTEALQCTPKGQVMLIPKARSVVDLNVELSESWKAQRADLWKKANREKALKTVRELAGIGELKSFPNKAEVVDTIAGDGYVMKKLLIASRENLPIPALLFQPTKITGKRYLYLHGDAKDEDARNNGPILKLVREGNVVLSIDACGIGETGSSSNNLWGGNWNGFFLSYLLGQSLCGMRAEDVTVSARYLSTWNKAEKPSPVNVIAVGVMGPPTLHAAALEADLFAEVKLIKSLTSWAEYLHNPATPGQLVNVVQGALKAYDLPDLVRAFGEEKVKILNPIEIIPLGQR